MFRTGTFQARKAEPCCSRTGTLQDKTAEAWCSGELETSSVRDSMRVPPVVSVASVRVVPVSPLVPLQLSGGSAALNVATVSRASPSGAVA